MIQYSWQLLSVLMSKYDIQDPAIDPETGILKNKFNITSQAELNFKENQLLSEAYDWALDAFEENHIFCVKDIQDLHSHFLGSLYGWAGVYRTVDLSSKDIHWCHARFVPQQLEELDSKLSELQPLSPSLGFEEIIRRIALIHGELVVIHPFRDGNGRVSRLFANLMFSHCDLPLLQLEHQMEEDRQEYFAAIRQVCLEKDYTKLRAFFARRVVSAS